MPITLVQDLPLVQVRFQGGPMLTASIDSGSPLTIVDLGDTGHKVAGELRLEDQLFDKGGQVVIADHLEGEGGGSGDRGGHGGQKQEQS